MARGKGRRLTYKDEKILDDLIQQNATISRATLAKDRIVLYNEGWSDARVLAALNEKTGAQFSMSSVTRFRSLQLGKLPASGGSPNALQKTPTFLVAYNRLMARQMMQEERLAAIERHLREQDGYEVPALDRGVALPVKDLTARE